MKKKTSDALDGAVNTATESYANRSDATRILQETLKLSNRLVAPFLTYLASRHEISLNEFRLLMLIGQYPNIASHELVDMTGVNPMSVSRAVATLEKHGRILVVKDSTNRRRKALALSQEGRKLYDAMLPQTEKVAEFLVSALTPAEVRKFTTLLGKLTGRLAAEDEQGRSLFMEHTKPAGLPVRSTKGRPSAD
jgi:DNA-binding MarR family transcriptional regulator